MLWGVGAAWWPEGVREFDLLNFAVSDRVERHPVEVSQHARLQWMGQSVERTNHRVVGRDRGDGQTCGAVTVDAVAEACQFMTQGIAYRSLDDTLGIYPSSPRG